MSSPDESKPKYGAGHAAAMGRQGLAELRGALYPESNVAQRPEYGLYGTRTQGEIADDREVDVRDESRVGPSVDDQHQAIEQERDGRDDERELRLSR
jgi:hypothetical protein